MISIHPYAQKIDPIYRYVGAFRQFAAQEQLTTSVRPPVELAPINKLILTRLKANPRRIEFGDGLNINHGKVGDVYGTALLMLTILLPMYTNIT